MPTIKPKKIRLIDLIELFAYNEIVAITTDHGRTSDLCSIIEIREKYKHYLNKEVMGMAPYERLIKIYLQD